MEIALVQEVELNERALVARARDGDREAFGELVTCYMRRAYYVALGLVGSHDDALDLVVLHHGGYGRDVHFPVVDLSLHRWPLFRFGLR